MGDGQQATSDERRATSDERRATSSERRAASEKENCFDSDAKLMCNFNFTKNKTICYIQGPRIFSSDTDAVAGAAAGAVATASAVSSAACILSCTYTGARSALL